MFRKRSEVNFVERGYIKDEGKEYQYSLMLPDFLAEWDVWDYWERERTESIRDNLKEGDILFDVGAEVGWLSAIYAKFVGAENMVLFEPSKEFWANIKETWDRNNLKTPKGIFVGCVGEDSNVDRFDNYWTEEAYSENLVIKMAYKYLDDKSPRTSIDNYVEKTGIIPKGITIDIEGAELLALKGAENTIKKHKPLLWVSIHPDLALRDYRVGEDDVNTYLESLGYKGKLLRKDHEEHWLYEFK